MVVSTTSKNSSTKQSDKNNTENSVRWGNADEISLFKAFLHNCGRADILIKQFKKTKQNNRILPTFSKSQKTHELI